MHIFTICITRQILSSKFYSCYQLCFLSSICYFLSFCHQSSSIHLPSSFLSPLPFLSSFYVIEGKRKGGREVSHIPSRPSPPVLSRFFFSSLHPLSPDILHFHFSLFVFVLCAWSFPSNTLFFLHFRHSAPLLSCLSLQCPPLSGFPARSLSLRVNYIANPFQ
jgi:hypothetical protein